MYCRRGCVFLNEVSRRGVRVKESGDGFPPTSFRMTRTPAQAADSKEFVILRASHAENDRLMAS